MWRVTCDMPEPSIAVQAVVKCRTSGCLCNVDSSSSGIKAPPYSWKLAFFFFKRKKKGQHTWNLTQDLTHTPGKTCFHLGSPSSVFLTVQTQSMHMKVIRQTRWQVFPPVPGILVARSHLSGIWFLFALKIPTNKEPFGLIYEPWKTDPLKTRREIGAGFNSQTIFALPASLVHRSFRAGATACEMMSSIMLSPTATSRSSVELPRPERGPVCIDRRCPAMSETHTGLWNRK